MQPERWQRIEELFQSALECMADERAALLASACADDEALQREVESLLAFHEHAEGVIDSPAFEEGLQVFLEGSEDVLAGLRIGPYKLVREIGRGGMGAVYLAVRDDDVYEQRVAVKLIQRGMDTDAVVSRFRRERQILALLEHPNIARLLDGGTTEDGRPYFVMEYIDGLPIDRYCAEHGLTTDERLLLFRRVCAAVQFAHQNLVIHRDLKPGNILVTPEGTPKLMDFGIARLLDDGGREERTATALRVLTPEYASPEQVRGTTVTTASDVYSLGVLLYELLTGRRPYCLKNKSAAEVERAVCDEEPERPSVAVTRPPEEEGDGRVPASDTQSGKISVPRVAQPEKLRRRLAGDLDNIMLMALRKEPERRYSSVGQFSEDVRRHLEGLPVVAHKDTLSYRTAKFVRRHKGGVVAAALVFLTLVAGLVATAGQAHRAAGQARLAAAERDRARVETAKAERINAFMQTIFSYADPSWYSPGAGRHGDVKVIEALNAAAGRIDTELADQPEVRAELHHTIGSTYQALGLFDRAKEHFRAAIELYRALYGEQHPKIAENLYYLAAAQTKEGDQTDEETYRQAIAMMRAVDRENVNLPYMLQDLGGVLAMRGDAQAEPMLGEALELFRRHYGEEHITVAETYTRFGTLYEARGDLERAQAMLGEALVRGRRLPEAQAATEVGGALSSLARIHQKKGEYAEAAALYGESLELQRKVVGDNHPSVAQIFYALARLHYLMRDYGRAGEEADRALEIARRMYSEESPLTTGALAIRCEIAFQAGQPARARASLREALDSYRTVKDAGKATSGVELDLGECLILSGRYAEAETLLLNYYNDCKSRYGEQHAATVEAHRRVEQFSQARGGRAGF